MSLMNELPEFSIRSSTFVHISLHVLTVFVDIVLMISCSPCEVDLMLAMEVDVVVAKRVFKRLSSVLIILVSDPL